MAQRLQKVAIVGGGVSGLLALRHLLKFPHLRPTLFEATGNIGGVWVYDGNQNQFEENNHQMKPLSVYRNLVSNQSKQMMEFPDFKHNDSTLPTFLDHEYVIGYLKRFAKKFQLNGYFQLNHRVQKISWLSDSQHWVIKVSSHEECVSSHVFDAVVLCNGHFTTPNIPKIQGLEYFKGRSLHSRYYRHPEEFSDQVVLLIGAGISGLDIALDISQVSTKDIYVSNRGTSLKSELPSNIHEVPEVSHFNEDGHSIIFSDGQTISVDTVIFATGFLFDYPFLDKNCGIRVNQNRITHLFKHIVNIRHPSMLFVGIPDWTPQFQLLYLQADYISKVVAGEISLPTENEMLLDESQDFKSIIDRGLHPSKAHNMFGISLEYLDYLADASGVDRMPNYLKTIYNHVVKMRKQDLINFKNDVYRREDFE